MLLRCNQQTKLYIFQSSGPRWIRGVPGEAQQRPGEACHVQGNGMGCAVLPQFIIQLAQNGREFTITSTPTFDEDHLSSYMTYYQYQYTYDKYIYKTVLITYIYNINQREVKCIWGETPSDKKQQKKNTQ